METFESSTQEDLLYFTLEAMVSELARRLFGTIIALDRYECSNLPTSSGQLARDIAFFVILRVRNCSRNTWLNCNRAISKTSSNLQKDAGWHWIAFKGLRIPGYRRFSRSDYYFCQ